MKELPVPLASIDDLATIEVIHGTAVTKIIKYLFASFPSGWRITGHMDSMAIRPFTNLIVKISILLFGLKAFPFSLLKAISWSVTSTMILLFVYQITNDKVFSLGAGLFYFLAPALGHGLTWSLGDFDIIAQLLTSIAFYLFLKLYLLARKDEGTGVVKRDKGILLIIGVIAFSWLALKTKESVIYLPLVIFLFLALDLIRKRSLRNLFDIRVALLNIYIFTLGLALLIPKWGGGQGVGMRIFPQAWLNLFIWNRTGLWWPPERCIALMDPKPRISTSLLGTFGFYLAWLFLFSFFGLISRKRRRDEETKRVFYQFSVVWLTVVSLSFLFVNGSDFRYLAGPLIPSTIIVFSVLHFFSSPLTKYSKRLFHTVLLLALAITLIINLHYSTAIRSIWGGFHIALDGIVKKMYGDQYNKPETSLKDLVEANLWFRSEGGKGKEIVEWWKREGVDLRLRNNVVSTFGGYSDAPPTIALREKAVKERVDRFGHCYLMDRKQEELTNHSSKRITLIKHDLPVRNSFLEREGLEIELLGVFSSIREGIYSRSVEFVRSKVLNKHPFVYFLYKIKPDKGEITHS